MRRFPFRPMEARPPDLTVPRFQEALRKAMEEVGKRETKMVRYVPGCDGRNIVTAYQGSCQDQARASAGGQAGIAVDLGNGARVVLASDLGRGYSASSGYSGAGLSAGAFPAPSSAAAVDLELDPIDSLSGVTIEGEPADTGAALAGATIEGKAGSGRFSAYAITSISRELWYWADVTTADPPMQVTTTSANLSWVAQISATRAVALDNVTATLWFFESGVEDGSYHVTELTAFMTNPEANDRFSVRPGGDELVMFGTQYVAPAVPYDPGIWYAVVYVTGLLTGTCTVEVASIRGAMAAQWIHGAITEDGTAYLEAYNYDATTYTPTGLYEHTLYRWNPPHTGAPTILRTTYEGTTAVFGSHVVDDGNRYIVAQSNGASPFPANLWRVGGSLWTTMQVSGSRRNYGHAAFDSAGNLWQIADDGYGTFYLQRYIPPHTGIPVEEITIGTNVNDLLAVTADGYLALLNGNDDAVPGFRYVQGPLAAGATVADVAAPGADGLIALAAAPRWIFADAAGLTLAASCTSIAPDGTGLEIVTTLSYHNGDALDAFGVLIEFPLPASSTFVSASAGGLYDSDAGIIRWLLPLVAAATGGTVTLTTRRG